MWVPMHRRPNFLSNKRRKPQLPSFLLPVPKTKKLDCENKRIADCEIGHASMQGYRVSMEDQHVIDSMTDLEDHVLVAIMDGHAGTFSAEFTSSHLKTKIEDTAEWKKYSSLSSDDRQHNVELIRKAMVQAYVNLDEDLKGLKECGIMDESGCTLVAAIITPSHIVCANVGDSRCILGRKDEIIAMTEDHKPSLTEEKLRIENAGGFVRFDRVNGELAMSRAIGDFRYKEQTHLELHEHLVICLPDVSVQERSSKQDEVLVLACDGVWDVINNAEAVQFVSNIVLSSNGEMEDSESGTASEDRGSEESSSSGSSSSGNLGFNLNKRIVGAGAAEEGAGSKEVTALEAAESLIDLALRDGSTDNISAIVVKFLSK